MPNPMVKLVDASTSGDALVLPAPVATLATTGVVETAGYQSARLFFGGTDAANEAYNYQVVLWTKFAGVSGQAAAYWPIKAALGLVTLGAATLAVANFGAAATLIADGITDTYACGLAVDWSPADDGMAWLDVDLRHTEWLEVETDLTTAASATVFAALSTEPIRELVEAD